MILEMSDWCSEQTQHNRQSQAEIHRQTLIPVRVAELRNSITAFHQFSQLVQNSSAAAGIIMKSLKNL